MAEVSARATAACPCPCCGSGSKGCSTTDDGAQWCRGDARPGWKLVARGEPFNTYRRETDDGPRRNGHHAPAAGKKPTDWRAIADGSAKSLTADRRHELARALGLPAEALARLPLVGFVLSEGCWSFPECDGTGRVVGITRRFRGGAKKAVQGSSRGLTLVEDWRQGDGPLLLVEGASDTLALAFCGLAVVGRPSNTGGVEQLAALLRDWPADRPIIVVGENDEKPSGQWPGKDGVDAVAPALAKKLRREVKTAFPPDGIKDARAWVLDLAKDAGEAVDWREIGREIAAFVLQGEPAILTPRPALQLVSRALAGVTAAEVRWLWRDRVPAGMLTILDGDPSKGKSVITIDLAARLSRGRAMPFRGAPDAPPTGVLFLAAEDSAEYTIKPRAVAADADLARCRVSECVRVGDTERPIRLPDDIRALEREITAHGIGLVVIDPFLGFLSQAIDSHKDQSVRDVLHQLKLLADRTGAGVLALRHLSKGSGGGNALYRGMGSIGITAAARSALTVGSHPSEPDVNVMAATKLNIARPPRSLTYRIRDDFGRPVVEWIEECDLTAADLDAKPVVMSAGPRERAKAFLCDLLAGGPMKVTEILRLAEIEGITEVTAKRAKADLGLVAEKTGFTSATWMWSFPPEGDHLPPEGDHLPPEGDPLRCLARGGSGSGDPLRESAKGISVTPFEKCKGKT